MNDDSILMEVEAAFPFVEMPVRDELTIHLNGCHECDELREELDYYRNKDISAKTIQLVSSSFNVLSAKATRWILPYYLRFCLTPEAEYSRTEIESLIYAFGPSIKFKKDTSQRLSLLSRDQINCLMHFFEWCLNDEYWKEYCPENIDSAINFMKELKR